MGNGETTNVVEIETQQQRDDEYKSDEEDQKFMLGSNGTTSLNSTTKEIGAANNGVIPANNNDHNTNKIDREFLNLKRDPLFTGSSMGLGPTGPDQLTTAITLAGAIKYFGSSAKELFELVDYISQETWEDEANGSREVRIQQLVTDKKYLRFRELLSDFVHLVLASCSTNRASNLVEFISLRGRYLGLDQVAGDGHINAFISFAGIEEIKFGPKKFEALRDSMITSEMVQDFLKQNSDSSTSSTFYKVVIPQKSSKLSIDWDPLVSKDNLPNGASSSSGAVKQLENADLLYVGITSKRGLFNSQAKFLRGEGGEEMKKVYTYLETFLVAQFPFKPKATSRVVRKR